ncbi:S41 family peptidase [Alkaliflexus imshenetskii]|uniref:S41 family peptidase n=1 Tax=Alkaliflexus imshenetskii TaxID=286730 RepID=UPI0004B8E335|nr:S41 family peptidase [Alkaliflexus imshenetskii]
MRYKNSLKQIVLPVVLALVLIVGFFIGKIWTPGHPQASGSRLFIYPQTNKIEALLNLIQDEYVDTIDKNDLIEKIIPEILKNLDPHTVYIPAQDLKTANQELEGNFGGIGVQFSMQNDTVMVISVVSGGPSEKLGIIPGDRIITVNDSTIAGVNMNSDNVVGMLRGEMGTKVNVGILRRDRPELINFEITRGSIPVYSVDVSYMITDSIGYIKVSRFARNTYQEFLTAMARLKAHNCQNVIIDLRGNSGGYLDVAISMSNEFLGKGDLIVYTEGKSSPRQNVYANGAGSCQNVGVTVLIDEFSASASEILAGAIQDNDRGLVVGRRSFGKGLVQQQIPLPDGSAIRLTVARYYTPSGRCIQKPYENGVEDYHRDILARFEHGEFFERDSILLDESLRYQTRGGREVYGGGGVMPDVFVPRDTSALTDYFFALRDRGLIYRFALQYTDDNRLQLQRFETVTALKKHLDSQPITEQLIRFATRQGVPFNETQYRRSLQQINVEVKAYIARNILDNDGFYPVFHEIDEMVKTAIREIRAGNDRIKIANP